MFDPCSISRIIFVSVIASIFFATLIYLPSMVLYWENLKDRSFWEEVIVPTWSVLWAVSLVICFVFNLVLYKCKY